MMGGQELRGDRPWEATAVAERARPLGAVGVGEKWTGQ